MKSPSNGEYLAAEWSGKWCAPVHPRGCPSTFQLDRCVVVEDTNGNGSNEIVFDHPDFLSLLCIDGANGKSIWQEPFHLPNLDGMVERAVAVSDMDGDGWKELLCHFRFEIEPLLRFGWLRGC